ncbi:STAS domain-containing protein [Pseudonocardia nigra]|uniref:STAS domain-containing protein n=1 Tax=Pseudonocardia nigra TaxID=1921578 RepID=UPI001C5CCB70|nr:STAS domain-containing protein [Pseudonocardia nigra]
MNPETAAHQSTHTPTVFAVELVTDSHPCEARLRGALDATATHRLSAVVEHLVRSDRPHVVFDLAELDLLAAAGLSSLLRADVELRGAGGSLTLTNVPRPARKVLAITGLDERLTLAPPAGGCHQGA